MTADSRNAPRREARDRDGDPSYDAYRDAYGIPHLRAANLHDLGYAQGYETARDRAWHLELDRLRGEGRVASVLGARALSWDTFAVQAQLDEVGQRAFARLSRRTRHWVTAYVDGVNAAFDDGITAQELDDVDARPGHWSPWTPLTVFLVHHVLFGSYPSKLWRQHVTDALGADALDVLRMEAVPASGSNAFVVGSARTATGFALIAGDPHRAFEAPNVYAQIHLACPEFDVVGLAFPGVPGIQHFAHAGSVAWAVTNAMADYQDLYAEQLSRRDGEVWAAGPSGEEPVSRAVVRIDVHDSEPVEVEVLVTERGPVIIGGPDDDVAMSLRTPAWVDGDLGFETLLPLLGARSVADVEAAFEHWVEPVNNLVIADRSGVAVRRVVGRVPVGAPGDRVLPLNPTDAQSYWDTYLEELPRAEVASGAHLVTANERADASYDTISAEFAPPFRADRLNALLDGRTDLTVTDAAAVLMDTQQNAGRALLTFLAGLDGLDAAAAALRDRLLAWDRRMDAASEDAGLYGAVRAAFIDRICASPDLVQLQGSSPYGDLYDGWFVLGSRVATALPQLLAANRPFGLDLAALARAALDEVAAAPAPGPWGERHRFHPVHGLEQLGLAQVDLGVTGEPISGDSDCVASTAWALGADACMRGPVARYVWNLADRDQSLWAVPLGASGDAESPHHHDQFEPWSTGRLVPVVTDWAILEEKYA